MMYTLVRACARFPFPLLGNLECPDDENSSEYTNPLPSRTYFRVFAVEFIGFRSSGGLAVISQTLALFPPVSLPTAASSDGPEETPISVPAVGNLGAFITPLQRKIPPQMSNMCIISNGEN